ncbi:hypothetical protein [Pleomorphomonas oryzae]|nr:hypothetical protein [Pleomorphomonas oryzae]
MADKIFIGLAIIGFAVFVVLLPPGHGGTAGQYGDEGTCISGRFKDDC